MTATMTICMDTSSLMQGENLLSCWKPARGLEVSREEDSDNLFQDFYYQATTTSDQSDWQLPGLRPIWRRCRTRVQVREIRSKKSGSHSLRGLRRGLRHCDQLAEFLRRCMYDVRWRLVRTSHIERRLGIIFNEQLCQLGRIGTELFGNQGKGHVNS